MEDLFFRITAGPSPNIDWTVALEFVSPKMWKPLASSSKSIARYIREEIGEPMAKNGIANGGNVIPLTQIVKTGTVQSVETLSLKEFYFHFCPDRGTGSR